MNETYSVQLDDGSGDYHFKLNDQVNWFKYLLTGSGFIISLLFIFRQNKIIELLTGDEETTWETLPLPELHPDYDKML